MLLPRPLQPEHKNHTGKLAPSTLPSFFRKAGSLQQQCLRTPLLEEMELATIQGKKKSMTPVHHDR